MDEAEHETVKTGKMGQSPRGQGEDAYAHKSIRGARQSTKKTARTYKGDPISGTKKGKTMRHLPEKDANRNRIGPQVEYANGPWAIPATKSGSSP